MIYMRTYIHTYRQTDILAYVYIHTYKHVSIHTYNLVCMRALSISLRCCPRHRNVGYIVVLTRIYLSFRCGNGRLGPTAIGYSSYERTYLGLVHWWDR